MTLADFMTVLILVLAAGVAISSYVGYRQNRTSFKDDTDQ